MRTKGPMGGRRVESFKGGKNVCYENINTFCPRLSPTCIL